MRISDWISDVCSSDLGSLIVAGGANFPEGTRPWSGGVKQWSDQVFALEGGSNRWTRVGHLPRPMGYGASVAWRDSIIIIGGADQRQHYADVYALTYTEGELTTSSLTSLPAPQIGRASCKERVCPYV